MITRLIAKNFRSLRDVTIDFEPLTVFVGANGSGKSNAIAALTRRGFNGNDHWQHRRELVMCLNSRFSDMSEIEHQLENNQLSRALRAGHNGEARQLPDCQTLQLDLGHLRSENTLTMQSRLSGSGQNLANLIYSIGRKVQFELAARFCKLVPIFGDIDLVPTDAGQHEIVFTDRWNPATKYRPSDVSDGTMLLLAYLLLAHQTPVPDLVAIEEPERGLHPYLLKELVSVLRKLTTGELGTKPIQVILATHSAELVNLVRPEEVRFFSRSREDGGTVVERAPTDSPNWKSAFLEYEDSLRGMWLSGNLGGVPGT